MGFFYSKLKAFIGYAYVYFFLYSYNHCAVQHIFFMLIKAKRFIKNLYIVFKYTSSNQSKDQAKLLWIG